MNSAYRNNLEYSRSLQEKYEYYLVALTFTLLALSVQTATFTDDKAVTILELLGWASLLVSGFIALTRMELQPSGHENFAILDAEKEKLSALKSGNLVASHDTGQVIQSLQAWIDRNEPILEDLESKLIFQYRLHKYLFFSGVSLIIVSRGYSAFMGLFGNAC